MAANNRPFVYTPTSIEIRDEGDGALTLDADTYAFVKVTCKLDGTFEIDNEQVVTRDISTNPGTVSANYIFKGQGAAIYIVSWTAVTVGGVTAINGPSPPPNSVNNSIAAADGQVMTGAVSGWQSAEGPSFAEFWVPPGTKLEGKGNCKYVVTKYANPKP